MKNNIILIGMPGCGKTTLGKSLSNKLNMKFYDLDEYIEKRENMSIQDIFKNGEERFRNIESEALSEVCKNQECVIATGGGIVKKQCNIDIMKSSGIVIFIDRPLENIFKDIKIENRPLLNNGKEELKVLYNERYELYTKSCHYRLENSKDEQEALNGILNIIFSL
ncbi:shikimate kinase [Haloimpatiens massiliensis]|uniref:shikimate kinase n=1 Tax=Haloimpatiens massiliensis TaxID=1658110 RepID=UPI000C85E852|nr:shikimate kinase [Haloimpatiens massiliensis]